FVEQQSAPELHVCPMTPHAVVPVGAGSAAQAPSVQVPVQHSPWAAHAAPTSSHCSEAQKPLRQLFEQHSTPLWQVVPAAAQKVWSVQVPVWELHVPEQQPGLMFGSQVSPVGRHWPSPPIPPSSPASVPASVPG